MCHFLFPFSRWGKCNMKQVSTFPKVSWVWKVRRVWLQLCSSPLLMAIGTPWGCFCRIHRALGCRVTLGRRHSWRELRWVSERRKVKKGDWRPREDLLPMWTKFYTNRKSPWEKWIDILHYVQRADSSICADINHKFFLAVLFILGAISRGRICLRTWDTGRKFRGTSSG